MQEDYLTKQKHRKLKYVLLRSTKGNVEGKKELKKVKIGGCYISKNN